MEVGHILIYPDLCNCQKWNSIGEYMLKNLKALYIWFFQPLYQCICAMSVDITEHPLNLWDQGVQNILKAPHICADKDLKDS